MATLDVSRGWRDLDGSNPAGSNPDCSNPSAVTTATLFVESAATAASSSASSSSSSDSIASLVSGDDHGNLRVERIPLGAGYPSHVVPRAHAGEVTCISDAGGGTFLTGGEDGATAVWDATRANHPPRRVATLRHHVAAIRAVLPLDVHDDGRGGSAGGPAAAALTVDREGAVGLASIPRLGAGESDDSRAAPRCEALFPAAPGRGALEYPLGPRRRRALVRLQKNPETFAPREPRRDRGRERALELERYRERGG